MEKSCWITLVVLFQHPIFHSDQTVSLEGHQHGDQSLPLMLLLVLAFRRLMPLNLEIPLSHHDQVVNTLSSRKTTTRIEGTISPNRLNHKVVRLSGEQSLEY